DPVRLERIQSSPDGLRPDDLPSVRYRPQSTFSGGPKGGLAPFGRIEVLLAAEADADDAPIPIPDRVVDCGHRVLKRSPPRDIWGQPDLYAVAFLRFLQPVAVAGEDLVPTHASPRPLDRGEIPSRYTAPCREA